VVALSAGPGAALAQGVAPAAAPDSALAIRIAGTGLEGVAASRAGAALTVAYENRTFRHPATALGLVWRHATAGASAPDTLWGIERRLGLACAAFPCVAGEAPRRVIYPGDRSFPAPPAGRRWGSTEQSLDFGLRPLWSYELGRIFDPVLIRLELSPEVRIEPWPGARARASLIIPLRDDFEADETHPDIDRVRPGVTTLEQYAWLPASCLASLSGGLFDDNRYGGSVGLARPLGGGLAWLDAQADLTGFVAFTDSGTLYSTPSHWSGFAGATIRAPDLPLSLRLRAARFLYGDRGVEVQLQRSLGDLDVALFAQRVEGDNIGGVRLVLPLPPLDRTTGSPVRVQLADRFAVDYRNEVGVAGTYLSGTASREELMRSLDPSSLAAYRARFLRAAGAAPQAEAGAPEPVSLTGMTGMVVTPWCGVARGGEVELGYNVISKGGATDHRGQHRNDVYYGTIGFLPRVEVGLRWTTIPGLKAFQELVPDTKLTDSDRMVSGRLEALPPRGLRPGLAFGIEDAVGTRRFHSTYAVSGLDLGTIPLRPRMTVGYAPRVLTATEHALDGAFGALAVSPGRAVTAAVEHDSKRVNVLLGVRGGFGIEARVGLLGLRHPAAGVGWHRRL
jgi:hypothetical protein